MKPFAILIFSLLIVTTNLSAQFGKINRALERVVEKKVESALEKELEEAIEEAIEGDEEDKEEREEKLQEQADYSSDEEPLLQMEESSPAVTAYGFDFEYHMTIEEKGKTNDMIFYINESGNHSAIEMPGEKKGEKVITLFDVENRRNYYYQEENGKKTGMKIPYLNMQRMAEKSMEKNAEKMGATKVEALNKTKVVAGYTCKGFKVTSEESVSTVWVTEDIPLSYMDLFQMGAQQLPNAYAEHPELNGMMMEMESHPPGKEDKVTTWRCTHFGQSDLKLVNSEWGL